MLDAEGNPPVRANSPPRKYEPIDPKDITVEEIKMYKDCVGGMFFKAGLPFATIMHFVTAWKSNPEVQEQPPTAKAQRFPVKRALFFCSNVFLGTVFFAPFCYKKLLDMHNLKTKKNTELLDVPTPERAQPTGLPDDYHYPIDLTSNLNEAESTFTPEFSSSRILDEEPKKVTQGTTYEDLRNRHRSSYERGLPEHTPSGRSKTFLDRPSSTSEKEPQKIVRRNKYGDEIE